MGASCAPVERFAEAGVWARTSTPSASATGLVLPTGFDLADAEPEEDWVLVGENLAAPAGEVG
ncbi:hypothetical protein MN205_04115 [Kineococcus sp. TRM81007]|uniref:hypothetical protein n=1 Tax=Kineococcus sp. TRM81007 TaxID=2925831 RepID=UPI001F56924F|nr:hypothetical protein [Kineococcus sp. TRM81007]MCI2237674.1 hypothetical protein [Kineococcus sp. TRM81007]